MNYWENIKHWGQQVEHTVENTAKEVGKEMLNPKLQEHGVVDAPIVKNLTNDLSKLLSGNEKKEEEVIKRNEKDSDPIICYIKQMKVVKTQVKPKVYQTAKDTFNDKTNGTTHCTEYNQYKNIENNLKKAYPTLHKNVLRFRKKVLNGESTATIENNLVQNVTLKNICSLYMKHNKKPDFVTDACNLLNKPKPTPKDVCNLYSTYKSNIQNTYKDASKEVGLACNLYNNKWTKPLVELECRKKFPNVCKKSDKDCCTTVVDNLLNTYRPKINASMQTYATNYLNLTVMPTISKEVKNYKTQLDKGINQANTALGSCWTRESDQVSLNQTCYDLQSKFPTGEESCTNSNGCCFKLLDDVCKS